MLPYKHAREYIFPLIVYLTDSGKRMDTGVILMKSIPGKILNYLISIYSEMGSKRNIHYYNTEIIEIVVLITRCQIDNSLKALFPITCLKRV
jgi:hypothetical protein